MARDHIDVAEALDRYGADLAAWPDADLAGAARRAALADRGFRARLERQAALEAGLARLCDATDAEIAASGAAARVQRAALAAVPRRLDARRWALIAAALVVAAALGALADVTILAPAGDSQFEVVVLDPLVFGPTGTGGAMSDAARRRPRWLLAVLGVSLLVNAFFIGALATDLVRYSSTTKRHVSFELRWLEDRLAEPDFAVVAAAMAAARPEAESHFATLRRLRQELAVLAAAPTPDRALIDAKLVEIRTELNAMVTDSQRTAIDALLSLPPSARTSLPTPDAGNP